MVVICGVDSSSGKGLFSAFKENGMTIPSIGIMEFVASAHENDDEIPECVLDDDIQTYWFSREYQPFFTLNFGKNKVSLKGFTIHGITHPYTIAFNISGSNNGHGWELIKEYSDVGEYLHSKSFTFLFDQMSSFYNQIKLQSISSKNKDGIKSSYSFGMSTLEVYGVFASYQNFLCTQVKCNQFNYHPLIMILIYHLSEH